MAVLTKPHIAMDVQAWQECSMHSSQGDLLSEFVDPAMERHMKLRQEEIEWQFEPEQATPAASVEVSRELSNQSFSKHRHLPFRVPSTCLATNALESTTTSDLVRQQQAIWEDIQAKRKDVKPRAVQRRGSFGNLQHGSHRHQHRHDENAGSHRRVSRH